MAMALVYGCDAPRKESAVPVAADSLDNTVWSSYHSNGVDIITFRSGRCVNRFYDAITGEVDQEDNSYRIVKNYIEVAGINDTVRMYYEITAGGKTLTIYRSEADLDDNKPNVVFKKL